MFAGGLAGLIIIGLWAYCIFDVIRTDEAVVRNMPKFLWLIIVILIPTIGSIAWLALGRPERTGSASVVRQHPSYRRPVGPEDSPDFMLRAGEEVRRLRRWEEDLRRREEDLRRRDEEGPEQ